MYAVACLNNAALLHAAQSMMHAAVCCIHCCTSNRASLHSTLDIAFQSLHICLQPPHIPCTFGGPTPNLEGHEQE